MPTQHKVRQGDCISSIAYQYGFFPYTLWNHPMNAELKRTRKDLNALLPGDIVVIPDKQTGEIEKPSGLRHRFRRKGVPQLFRLQLLDGAEPRAGCAYRLAVEQREFQGRTDAGGWLEHWIDPDARQGRLILSAEEEYLLRFGHLDPVTSESGVRARLFNLGYLPAQDAETEAYRSAIRRFRQDQNLEATGTMNPATEDALVRRHSR